MVLNAFVWLAGANTASSGTVRVAALSSYSMGLANIKQALEVSGVLNLTATVLSLDSLAAGLWSAIDVIWIDTYTQYTSTQIQGVLKFANETGKGILVGGHAWAWGSQNPGANVFTDLPVNRILWSLGLLVTTNWQVGFQPTPLTVPTSWYYYNSYASAAAVLGATQGQTVDSEYVPMIKRMLSELLDILPPRSVSGEPSMAAVFGLLDRIMDSGSDPPAVGPRNPFDTTTASLGRWFKVCLEAASIRRADLTDLKPSPSAALFPGLPPTNAPRVEVTITVNATFVKPPYRFHFADWGAPIWRSTGLYAPPGKVVTVTVETAAAVNKGLQAQIGVHADDLTGKAVWTRMPYAVSRFPLDKKYTKIGSPLGGLIFVLVPEAAKLGKVQQITFSNVIKAPYFKLGDDPDRWESKVRQYPAPWAELDSGKFVIMLPSRAIRKLDDPTPVLKHWNKVLDSAAWLANINPDRARPERFVADAATGMHSGYPITAFNSTGVWNDLLNLTNLKTRGAWGLYQELGRNHLWSEMMFTKGCSDSFSNLFTIHVLESTGVPQGAWENWYNVSPSAHAAARAAYLAGGADFATDWGGSAALDTYLQLKDGFGWDFYRSVYAAYQNMTSPLTEDKTQTWIQTTCKVSGVNLVPFFSKWGFPVSSGSASRCSALPVWAANPMK